MEISGTDEVKNRGSSLGGMFWFLTFIASIFAFVLVKEEYQDGAGFVKTGGATVSIIVLYAILLPLAWKIGDSFRKSIIPDAYYTHGVQDSIKKKIFWLYGPQSMALGGASIIALNIVGMVFYDFHSNKPEPKQQINITTPDKNIQEIPKNDSTIKNMSAIELAVMQSKNQNSINNTPASVASNQESNSNQDSARSVAPIDPPLKPGESSKPLTESNNQQIPTISNNDQKQ